MARIKRGPLAIVEANRDRQLFWVVDGKTRYAVDAATWPVTCSCPTGQQFKPCAHFRAVAAYCRRRKLPFGPPIRSAEENEKLLALFGKKPWDRPEPTLIPWSTGKEQP